MTLGPHAAAAREAACDTRAIWCAYALGLLVAAGLGHFLLGLPIQVSDSFGNMQKLSAPWGELLAGQFSQSGFLRPFLWAELKTVFDLSGGNYTPWYRATHAVQGAALVLLFVRLFRPRVWRDAAIVPFGLAVLLGMHTFVGTVREAFPINTFMTILLCAFAAAALAVARYRWWNDVLAAVLFVVASLTVETGLLVWVIVVCGALLGAGGVSRFGIAALILLLAGYFYVRFGLFDVGSPGLVERSSGFGFRVLEPSELMQRFGDNPIPFYLYNAVTSALSVLFSEPSAGVFRTTQAVVEGEVRPVMMVNAVASIGATALVLAYAWLRRREWFARRFDHDDRLVLLSGGVLAANAVISYPYTKDVVMSPAGAFLALAVCASARGLIGSVSLPPRPLTAGAFAVVAFAVSSAWGLRVLALHHTLRQAAVTERLDWAYIDSDVAEGHVQVPDAAAKALLATLRHEALVARPAPPPLDLPFKPLLGIED
jgi:hypothetical protein